MTAQDRAESAARELTSAVADLCAEQYGDKYRPGDYTGGLFADWAQRIEVDPGMPPGTIDMRSGGDRLRAVLPDAVQAKVDDLWRRAQADPVFAAELEEEITSLNESAPWLTQPGEMSKPAKCEVCGTLVTVVPEVRAYTRTDPQPGLWEPGQWRRHTPRRCRTKREET
jgi:hypothetical protein